MSEPLDVGRELKRLRRVYERDVAPGLKRHAAAESPGERRRHKSRSARWRDARAAERTPERNGGPP